LITPDWNTRFVEDYATLIKGKMPKTLLKVPTLKSLPYLLIDGLGEGETLHTEETHLPIIGESDTAVVADGSRSGLAIRGVRGVLGSTLLAYRPKEGFDADYLFCVLESLYPYNNTATIGGAIPHLDKRLLAKLSLATPGAAEQRRIAAALKLAGDAIAKTKAELEATRELKRSFAHKALESGFGSSELIDSKFWSYPNTWDLVCVKHLLTGMDAGASPMCESDAAKPGHWGVLKVSAVSWDRFEEMENKALPATIEPDVNAEVKVGDIIVSRANTTELCGAVHRVQSLYTRLLLCDKTWRLHPKEEVNPDWLVAVLKHPQARRQIEANATGTSDSMKNIGKRDFRNVVVPRPSRDEQDRIAEALNAFDANIEANVKKVEALQQVKKSLLQNLLTGRIRIPEGAIHG
jgi:type I restriction enzyme S subunit